jgi:hypothetical protein
LVSKTSILKNLSIISKLYNKTSNPKEVLFYSKLAILELCGWIEESMDNIVENCANRKLRNNDNLKFLEKEIIKRVHSFDYHNNFRKMLMQVIGLIRLEIIESKVDQTKLELMKVSLNALKEQRDPVAHTHIKGITLRIDAPSITKQRIVNVYEGLKNIEHELKRL